MVARNNSKPEFMSWYFDSSEKEICASLEAIKVWGNDCVRLWYPHNRQILIKNSKDIFPIGSYYTDSATFISFLSTHAKINDTLGQNELLSPILSSVIPLPHQLNVLSTAIKDGKYRLLLADEVGLGKTIEAGLIMRELKLRGLVKRVLVVAPKGLVAQWVAEMKTHFNEDFRLILPNEQSNKYQSSQVSIWEEYDNVVCSMDSVKPIEFRRGWNATQVKEYNKLRYSDLINAKWDLVIIDEAHRMGGSLDVIARYKLGKALSITAPYFLMLSATPHQGKTEAFFRLMQLLDEDAFPDLGSITKDRLKPFVIRTEKRNAIDAEGNKLFKPRIAHLYPVSWEQRHSQHKLLYESVTNYVVEGYNKAIEEKKYYQAFLMILMQRLVTSSTRAIAATLKKRLDIVEAFSEVIGVSEGLIEDDWNELDGEALIEELLQKRIKANEEEILQIATIIKLAEQCERISPDPKADALLSLLLKIQQEENNPHTKVLIFTEFVATQLMLQEILGKNNYKVVCLNGSMDLDERLEVQASFLNTHQILISTDAGGEGINLQFCHIVINYDLPWNPMRIEQRIGRVDRIGQKNAVRAFNFVLQETVEYRVREVLERKLALILKDLGIDKASDVLDASLSNEMFDELYMNALRNPNEIDGRIDEIVKIVAGENVNSRQVNDLLNQIPDVDGSLAKKLKTHPLPHWVERMTVSYIRFKGGRAEQDLSAWNLIWPDGKEMRSVTFNDVDASLTKGNKNLTLENKRIREILEQNTRFFPGQRMASVYIASIAKEVTGFFSIWQITITGTNFKKKRYLPIFIHNDNRSLNVTARAVWDYLLINDPKKEEASDLILDEKILQQHFTEAEKQGHTIWIQLSGEYQEHIEREKQKREYLFSAKSKTLDNIGLENVKASRIAKLKIEKIKSDEEIEKMKQSVAELHPVLFVYVQGVE